MFKKNDVVQFTSSHKWHGCFGTVEEIRKNGCDTQYLVGVPIPKRGTAYILASEDGKSLRRIGKVSVSNGQ